MNVYEYLEGERPPQIPDPAVLRVWGWTFVVMCLFAYLCLTVGCAQASEIPARKAVLAIIGEAEGEGYQGMLAVADALRHRGTLRGVYGLHSPRVVKRLYSAKTQAMANAAWLESATHDITNGATGWGNEDDVNKFCRTTWWRSCVVTAKVGNQWFYRRGR